ncbi:MAG: S8 family serine peptidase [Acidobacteriota bacterium]
MQKKLIQLFVLVALVFGSSLAVAESVDVNSKIAPGLLSQMDSDSRAAIADGTPLPTYRVVVDLQSVEKGSEMANAFASEGAMVALQANIRATQDRVLAGMNKARDMQFQTWNLYKSTYGFSAYAEAAAIRTLAENPDVRYVHEMPVYYKTDAQAHAITNTDDAHAAGETGSGVTIAIIDDGIDHDHPAFGGQSAYPNSKILGGRDFADNDNNPRVDCNGQSHGTSVAGVAAGNGGGVVGVAKDAKIVFLKIQGASICGQPALNGDVPGAIDWAVTNRNAFSPAIRIISMSLGIPNQPRSSACSSIPEGSALVAARNAGMVTLIASGNDGFSNGISAPSCHPDAVSVGATYDANIGGANFGVCNDSTTFADKITCYSNSTGILDILAPAHCAFTAQTGGSNTSCFGGTSSATPYAAGVTATLFSKDPSLSRTAAINALENGGVNITDSRNGITRPRVDTLASLALVGGGGGPPPGNCPAVLTSPANNSTTSGGTQTLTWSSCSTATQYWLYIGTSQGANNLYSANQGTNTSRTLSGFAQNGTRYWIRVWTRSNGSWSSTDSSFISQ